MIHTAPRLVVLESCDALYEDCDASQDDAWRAFNTPASSLTASNASLTASEVNAQDATWHAFESADAARQHPHTMPTNGRVFCVVALLGALVIFAASSLSGDHSSNAGGGS